METTRNRSQKIKKKKRNTMYIPSEASTVGAGGRAGLAVREASRRPSSIAGCPSLAALATTPKSTSSTEASTSSPEATAASLTTSLASLSALTLAGWRGVACNVLQSLRDGLARLAEEGHQTPDVLCVCEREEGVCVSLRPGTSGTSDTVHVVLESAGEVEVDDELEVADVETTCRNVGGDEDHLVAGSEVVQGAFTVALVLVSVDRCRAESVALQLVGSLVTKLLGSSKDKRLAATTCSVVADDLEHHVVLLADVVRQVDVLCDVGVGGELVGSNLDVHPVLKEVAGETLNLTRPGGRPEEGLAVGADLFKCD